MSVNANAASARVEDDWLVRGGGGRRTRKRGGGRTADYVAQVMRGRSIRLAEARRAHPDAQIGRTECGRGWHLRSAYATGARTVVPAVCKRGRTPTRIFLRPGGLPGYRLRDDVTRRRAALTNLLSQPYYERVAVRRRLTVLSTFNRRVRPEMATAAKSDADWVASTYGRTVDRSKA